MKKKLSYRQFRKTLSLPRQVHDNLSQEELGVLKKNAMLSNLRDMGQWRSLFKYLDVRQKILNVGDKFIAKGDPCDSLIILVQGSFIIYTDPENSASSKPSKILRPGDQLGEEACLEGIRGDRIKWTSDIIMVSHEVKYIQISRSVFFQHQHEPCFLPIKAFLTRYHEDLAFTEFFRYFDYAIDRNTVDLAHKLLRIQFAGGKKSEELLFREGTVATRLYFLIKGEAVCITQGSDQIFQEVRTIVPGQYCQLLETVHREKHTLSMTTNGPCEFIYLDINPISIKKMKKEIDIYYPPHRDGKKTGKRTPKNLTALELICKAFPALRAAISNAEKVSWAISRLRESDKVIFRQISYTTKVYLQESCRVEEFPSDIDIKEEGKETNPSFYIIISGAVEVIRQDVLVNTYNNLGDYFGQESLINKNPAVGTVRVVTDAPKLGTLRKGAFLNKSRTNIGKNMKAASSMMPMRNINHQSSRNLSKESSKSADTCICLVVDGDYFEPLLKLEPGISSEVHLRSYGSRCKLEHLLRHPKGRSLFAEHSKLEHSIESFDFISRVTQLQHYEKRRARKDAIKCIGIDPRQIRIIKSKICKDMVEDIYKTFVKNELLNLPGQLYNDLHRKIDQLKEYDFDIFNSAKEELTEMLDHDTFSRFKTTTEFKTFLKQIGCYETGPEL